MILTAADRVLPSAEREQEGLRDNVPRVASRVPFLIGSLAMAEKIILSTPVSHVDWMAGHSERIGHREKGVKYILDRCKQIGWRRIYWRCFEAGRAQYASKLMEEKWVGRNEDNYQRWANPDGESEESYRERVFVPYKGFDSLREAIDYGHKIGLEIHAWLTINEEDHYLFQSLLLLASY